MTNETKVENDGTASRPQTAPGIEKDVKKKKGKVTWSPQTSRPVTAPGGSSKKRKKIKGSNVTIRDLLEGKGMESASDTNQIVLSLKRDLQRTLNCKRDKLDTLKFKVKRKQRKIDKLRMKLKELMVDGEAMGVNEKREKKQKRMEPIRIISNRPIYHSRTDLKSLVKRLEKKQERTKVLSFRLDQYQHMLDTKIRVFARQLAKAQREQAVRSVVLFLEWYHTQRQTFDQVRIRSIHEVKFALNRSRTTRKIKSCCS